MSARQSNRDAMPTVAAMVDEIRAQGFPVKVIYASENGLTVGALAKDENCFDVPKGYGMTTNTPRGKK